MPSQKLAARKDAPGRGAPVRMLKRSNSMSHGIPLAEPTRKRPAAAPVRSAKKPRVDPEASPFAGFPRPTPQEVSKLHTALAQHFGERRPAGKPKRQILDTVVGTILSQNTTNTNSHRAFSQLVKKFSSWEKVRRAKHAEVEEAIRCGGLAPKKTQWIQAILQKLHEEHGKTSLEFLRKMSKQEVHDQLERFQGIGKKTSAIINLFDCGNPDMAVDTHVFRYALQLGWAPTDKERLAHNTKAAGSGKAWPVINRDTVYAHLDAIFPDSLKYSMHLILTDTEGGLPVVCGARSTLGFDGKAVSVDRKALKDVLKETPGPWQKK